MLMNGMTFHFTIISYSISVLYHGLRNRRAATSLFHADDEAYLEAGIAGS